MSVRLVEDAGAAGSTGVCVGSVGDGQASDACDCASRLSSWALALVNIGQQDEWLCVLDHRFFMPPARSHCLYQTKKDAQTPLHSSPARIDLQKQLPRHCLTATCSQPGDSPSSIPTVPSPSHGANKLLANEARHHMAQCRSHSLAMWRRTTRQLIADLRNAIRQGLPSCTSSLVSPV